PGLELVTDVARAEDRRGEGDEGRQGDEIDVEIVDDQDVAAVSVDGEERYPRHEGEPAREHVEHGAHAIARDAGQHHDGEPGNHQDGVERVDHPRSPRSPRNWSSALTSTVSKRSRMRKMKIPNTMNAIRIENAVENSTTS